jgi:tetratricopeptide (TPR) repeat protein
VKQDLLHWIMGLGLVVALHAADPDSLVRDARVAELGLDSRLALQLYLQANEAKPNDAFILQKIARQYSDLVADQPTFEEKKRYAQIAIEFSQRALALEPKNAVNILSLAICHGKLALYSDTRAKLEYSRLVKEEAEQALALKPDYAWAHHVLGRWYYEVASLGSTSKFLVRLFYGGLPAASVAESIKELHRATELEPDELNHWIELGFAYAAAGQPAQARAQWQRGLAMPTRGKPDESAKQRAREALARSD